MSNGVPAYSHIVVVVEENTNYDEIAGNTAAPYINSLMAGGANLTNFDALTHPSQPNYFALYAGSTFGTTDDNSYSEPDPTLYTILKGAGLTFGGYVDEGGGGSDFNHDPWVSFPEGRSVQTDFTSFPSLFPSGNYASLPSVSYVIPSITDDMHSGTIAQADTWLQQNLSAYAQWAKANNSLLVVVWDESDDSSSQTTNQIPALLYGANITPGNYNTAYNDYNLLATIADAFNVTAPNDAATAAPISGVFSTTPAAPTITSPANGSTDTTTAEPAIAGTGVSGDTVTISIDGTVAGAAPVVNSAWSYTPTSPLSNASHTISATQAASGGPSSIAATDTFTVAVPTAPAAPTIASPANGSTDTTTTEPVISGGGVSGDTVTISIDGTQVGTALVSNSAWSFTPTLPLSNASHTISATQAASGGPSSTAATDTFTVALPTAPAAPTIASPANGSTDTTTTEPVISGGGVSGDTVTISIDGTQVGTALVSNSAWSYTPTSPLSNASHTVTATQAVAGGPSSAPSAADTFTVDVSSGGLTISSAITGPLALAATNNPLTITSAGSITTTASGDAVSGGSGTIWQIINAGTISGTIGSSSAGIYLQSAGSTVQNSGEIYGATAGIWLEDGGDVTNGATGLITATGDYGVYIGGGPGVVTNAGTITGGWYAVDFATSSSANLLTVDPGAVFNGAVNGNGGVLELTAGSGSIGLIGSSAFSGFETLSDDASALWTLTGANTIADVTDNGGLTIAGSLDVSAAVNSASAGQFDLQSGGSLEVAADTAADSQIDFLGASQLIIDSAAGFGANIGNASYTGPLLEGFVSGDTIDIKSFSTANTSYTYNSVTGLLQIANGSQTASLDFQTSTLGSGAFSLTSDGGTGLDVTLSQATAPAAPTIASPANGSTDTTTTEPVISGGGVSGDTVTISIDGTQVGTALVSNSAWSFTPTLPLSNASHTISATQAASGGPSSTAATDTFTVALPTAPAAPTIASPANGSTDTTTTEPVISGGGVSGDTVTISIDGTQVGTALVSNSAWSYTPTSPLSNASHTVTATQAVAGGPSSAPSAADTFTVDVSSGGLTISSAITGPLALAATNNPLTITSAGSITTTASGDAVSGGSGTIWQIINAGTISGTIGSSSAGIYLQSAGSTVQNSGEIYGATAGIWLEDGGDVTNGATGLITATGDYGVYIGGGPGVVTNAGTITGGWYAVDFATSSSANLLTVDPGAVFNGAVNGNGGVLELTAGSGSIGLIGSSAFSGFETLSDDASALWTLTGANTIADVTDNGGLTIAGSLDVSAAVNSASAGQFDLQSGGSLEVAADTAADSQIDFLGASQLTIDNAALFGTGVGGSSYAGPLLENFAAGDTIDLHGFMTAAAALLYNPANGLLQITNGASQLATVDFQNSTLGTGSFSFASDGNGGTLIKHS